MYRRIKYNYRKSLLLPDVKADNPGLTRVAYASADQKIWRAIGNLSEELDLDAFLNVENRFTSDLKGTYLQTVEFALIGTNTVLIEMKKRRNMHHKVHFEDILKVSCLGIFGSSLLKRRLKFYLVIIRRSQVFISKELARFVHSPIDSI